MFAGQPFSLACEIHQAEGLTSQQLNIEWLDSQGNPITEGGSVSILGPVRSGTRTTLTLEFGPLHLVHSEEYSCYAMFTTTAPPFQFEREARLEVIVMGMCSDMYVCVFVCTAIACESNMVCVCVYTELEALTKTANSEFLSFNYITEPLLNVEVAPPFITACQNAPFSEFTLTCTVTLSNPVTLEERIEWRRGPQGSEVTLSADDPNFMISSSNLGDSTSTSVLTVSNQAARIDRYVCVAILDFPDNEEQIQRSALAKVTIKGIRMLYTFSIVQSEIKNEVSRTTRTNKYNINLCL